MDMAALGIWTGPEFFDTSFISARCGPSTAAAPHLAAAAARSPLTTGIAGPAPDPGWVGRRGRHLCGASSR